MKKIKCKLPNASAEISGVRFGLDEDGAMLSGEVDDEVAAKFAGIPGYEVTDVGGSPATSVAQNPGDAGDPEGGGAQAATADDPKPAVQAAAKPPKPAAKTSGKK